MATFRLIQDLRRKSKNNLYPLIFRVTVKTSKRDIPTGLKIPINQFNAKDERILNDQSLNLKIQNLKIDYQKKINLYLINKNGLIDFDDLISFLTKKPTRELTIYEFWVEQINLLNQIGRNGNAKSYKTALNVITQHLNLKKSFKLITYKTIVELENDLIKRGMSTNGVSVYLRAFKAIYNKAINMDMVGYEYYPFKKFKIKKSHTAPRVISLKEMRCYFNFTISTEDKYYKTWLIGKLIFMLRGINIKDLLLLEKNNIKNGRIIYRRAKTNKLYSIEYTKEIDFIIKQFNSNNDTLLGILSELELSDPIKLVETITQKRKTINAHLKRISCLIDVKEPITTYVFRYSFSNIAKQLGFSKDLISEALGHNYGNTTTTHYLEQFNQEELDKLTREVTKKVMSE